MFLRLSLCVFCHVSVLMWFIPASETQKSLWATVTVLCGCVCVWVYVFVRLWERHLSFSSDKLDLSCWWQTWLSFLLVCWNWWSNQSCMCVILHVFCMTVSAYSTFFVHRCSMCVLSRSHRAHCLIKLWSSGPCGAVCSIHLYTVQVSKSFIHCYFTRF